MTNIPYESAETADDADLAEQRTPVEEDEADPGVEVHGRDDVDEGDLLEQAMPVPGDEEDYPEG